MAKQIIEREFVVIGLGRFGVSLASALIQNGCSVLGIDNDPDIVQRYADDFTQTMRLDAADEEALAAADLTSFSTVIVAIGDNFEASVLTTASLKSIGIQRVICKALGERQAEILKRVGADRVILPEDEAGQRLALELTFPNLMNRMPLSPGYSIAEVHLPLSMAGKTLMKSGLRKRFNVIVLAIKRGEHMIIAPEAQQTLDSSDLLVVLGQDEEIFQVTQER